MLEGRCAESGASAFEPFRDALQNHLGWSRDTAAERRRADLTALLGKDDQGFGAAPLIDMFGLSGESAEGWQALPPAQRQRETFRAIGTVFRRMAREQPLVVVLEDLHWADPPTLKVTTQLFSVSLDVPLLVVCVYRPWRDHPCWQLSAEADALGVNGRRITLRELDSGSCSKVAAALLGVAEIPLDVRPLIVDRAEGNPLYLEEFIRSAVVAGWIARDDRTGWKVAASAIPQVPPTLELLVRARLDRLAPETRRILQLAAVQGRVFSHQVLTHLEGAVSVEAALAELERLDFVRAEPGNRLDEWAFKHVLVQETIEQGILRRNKRELHLRVLDALEQLDAEHLEERASQLAHHAEKAADASRAARYVALAAHQAKQAYMNEVAAELFARGIRWSIEAGLPPNEVALLHESRGDVLTLSGRHAEAVEAFEDGIGRAADALTEARLWRKAGAAHVVMRRYGEALDRFERAESLLPRGGGEPLARREQIDLELSRGLLHYWRNEPDAIGAAVDRIRPLLDEVGTPLQRADAFQLETMRIIRQRRYRDVADAIPFSRAAVEAAEQVPDPAQRAFKLHNLAFCHLWEGELGAALEYFAEATSLAEQAGDVVVLSRCHTYRAVAYRFLLDETRCLEETTAAMEVAHAAGMREYIGSSEGHSRGSLAAAGGLTT